MKAKTKNQFEQVWASGGRIRCHTLKSWPMYFHDVLARKKRAEIRINDRDYMVGDFLLMSEYIPRGESVTRSKGDVETSSGEFTGAWIKAQVTHITDFPIGLQAGYVMLSFEVIEDGELSQKDLMQVKLL